LFSVEKTSPGEGTLKASRKTAPCICGSVRGRTAESGVGGVEARRDPRVAITTTAKCLPISIILKYTMALKDTSFYRHMIRGLY
jgi:hypothetical protein